MRSVTIQLPDEIADSLESGDRRRLASALYQYSLEAEKPSKEEVLSELKEISMEIRAWQDARGITDADYEKFWEELCEED